MTKDRKRLQKRKDYETIYKSMKKCNPLLYGNPESYSPYANDLILPRDPFNYVLTELNRNKLEEYDRKLLVQILKTAIDTYPYRDYRLYHVLKNDNSLSTLNESFVFTLLQHKSLGEMWDALYNKKTYPYGAPSDFFIMLTDKDRSLLGKWIEYANFKKEWSHYLIFPSEIISWDQLDKTIMDTKWAIADKNYAPDSDGYRAAQRSFESLQQANK